MNIHFSQLPDCVTGPLGLKKRVINAAVHQWMSNTCLQYLLIQYHWPSSTHLHATR